jgi:hypothetical membrane protein
MKGAVMTTTDSLERTLAPVTEVSVRRVKRALAAGSLGGPIFVALVVIQLAIVPWFDITRLPLSILSIGETWYLQKAAFLLSGLLTIVGAIGLRRAIRGTPAGRFGPLLIGAFGAGLVLASVFNIDATDGAPPGTSSAAAGQYSWHMWAHNLSSMLAFVCLSIACFVFVRRFARQGAIGWAVASACVGASTLVLFFVPIGSASLRLAIASVVMFAWTSALFLTVRATMSELPPAPGVAR